MEQSSASTVESYFNLSDGHRLSVREVKKTAVNPTVFIHGNLASGHWWLPVIGLGQETSGVKSASSFVVDLLGHGLSSDPNVQKEMNPLNLARQMNEFISSLTAGLEEKVNIVGHSAGGLVSALAVSRQPEHYSRCLLLAPVGPEGMKFGVGVLESFKRAQGDEQWRRQVMSAAVNLNWADRDSLIDQMSQDFLRSSKGPGFWLIEECSNFSFKNELKNNGIRGRVLSGVHDLIVPPEDSRSLAEVIGFQFEKLSDFAHCPNTEDPNRFRKLMDAFFLSQDVFAQS